MVEQLDALDAAERPALTGRSRTWVLLRADPGWRLGISLLAVIVIASTLGPLIVGRAQGQLFRDQMPLERQRAATQRHTPAGP